ncbi:EAL domain-containing protein [Noviherbaspirillum sp.]|jgi:diguanylate cyclase (GGDEF)-like protein/PAS domain S-box-containing protein|uniref:EAL domain-containing protein n=1 Tax=Noviherbaspirillum sp. TaxID=1926288 RepID=UPI0025DE9882|nr:EAL domain-containing protein [Noviherbaspirillum sp.]
MTTTLTRLLAVAFLALPMLAQAAVLRVVTDDNYPPYLYRNSNGEEEGYVADIWKLWEEKTGIEVKLTATNWADAQRQLLDGKADVIDMIFRTPKREPLYDFSEPYARLPVAIYVDSSISGIHNIADLKGFEVGVQRGDACVEKLQAAGISNLRLFANYSILISAASAQEIKIFCLDEYPANYYLYLFAKQKQFVKAFDMYKEEFRWAVRKGNAETYKLVEQGMTRISAEEKEALKKKWLGQPAPFSQYSEYAGIFRKILAALSFAVVGLVIWLKSLQKAVERRTRELEQERAHLHALVENSPDLIWLKDANGTYLTCNPKVARLFGKTCEEIIGKTDFDFFNQKSAEFFRTNDLLALKAEQPRAHESWVTYPDNGETRLIEILKTPVLKPNGEVLGVLGVARDITERKRDEEKLREQDELLRQMSSMARIGAWDFDPATGQVTWTDEVASILDAAPKAGTDESYGLSFFHGENRTLIEAAFKEAVAHGTPYDLELKLVSAAGKHKWVRTICRPILVDGKVVKLRGAIQDITDQKLKDELIWKQNNFDALTGLPNRGLFRDRLEQEIKKAFRTGKSLALLFIDLDRFKGINDTLGHAKGDALLVEATRRITKCVRETDTVARLGGDEFTIIMSEFDKRPQLERVAQNLIQVLSTPFDLGDGDMGYVSGSVGITLYPGDGDDIEALMKNAEQAMYLAKKEGRSRFSYFTHSLQQEAQSKLLLTNELRQALARNELHVYYQPIVDTRTGRITKAEALLRWKHPVKGMIGPAIFIPLAEESGLIMEIGEWVFKEAISSIERWHKKFASIIQLSVNKSPVQFEKADHHAWLDRLVQSGLPASCVTVEITEGLLINDSARVKARLNEFQDRGVEVSIDDFGTGFSALSYLKLFDIDYLKIDKSFISNLPEDESDMALTEAIIVMAHKLGIKAIAEGVETEAQRDVLIAFGCDYIQGYLYSPPVPLEEFEALLEKQDLGERPHIEQGCK